MASANPEQSACGELSARERAERAVERGETLFSQNRIDEALALFEQAANDDPRSIRALNDLGVVLHKLGRASEALSKFDAVLVVAPDDATALVNKAHILVQRDHAIEAAACVRAVLRRNAVDLDAIELLVRLDLPCRGRTASTVVRERDAELLGALADAGVVADTNAPLLSVIATTCGKADATLALLDRLALQSLDPRYFELVLVDDGSTQDLRRALEGWGAPFRFEVVRREQNDATAAWKLGLARATGRWCLILGEGTLPARDTLRAHVLAQTRSRESCATAGSVGGANATTAADLAHTTNLALSTDIARSIATDASPRPTFAVRAHTDAAADGIAPEDRPVFLLGCAYRCGSTFLQRLLSSSPNLFVWGENMGLSDVLADVIDREAAWRWETYQADQWAKFEEKGLRTWLANLQPRGFPNCLRHALRAFYLDYYVNETRRLGRERWGFKEVHHGARAARFLLDLFPAGRAVFVTRNPVDVLASVSTTSWYDQVGRAERVLKLWGDNMTSMLDHRDARIQIVRYETFVAKPHVELARLGAHLGIPVDRFDTSLISVKQRGANPLPGLSDEELTALRDEAFVARARSVGYDVLQHPALREQALCR